MDKAEVIKILRNEKFCVITAEVCDRECGKCQLVMDSGKIIKAYDLAIEMLSEPEIIRCKDCKHRPKATRADKKVFSGFSVEFPDEKCPCQCGDVWYNWYPEDDFYCGYAEGREDG